ncbi:hypothetical protein CEXT_507791 [Caerostris extrusa]|uniref:Uncharacterized protein n=1 Tax=Caerostris extrusa TaxID=172846 RepID=A0AAV4XCM0_CAEEX|nr:hypothetical protein CEXT_507791 [Caerostris extrusa]
MTFAGPLTIPGTRYKPSPAKINDPCWGFFPPPPQSSNMFRFLAKKNYENAINARFVFRTFERSDASDGYLIYPLPLPPPHNLLMVSWYWEGSGKGQTVEWIGNGKSNGCSDRLITLAGFGLFFILSTPPSLLVIKFP